MSTETASSLLFFVLPFAFGLVGFYGWGVKLRSYPDRLAPAASVSLVGFAVGFLLALAIVTGAGVGIVWSR